MAPNNHLEWTRLDKFGGLWDAGGPNLMPADHAQVMSGCHPMPGGGLRAFYVPVNVFTSSGLHDVVGGSNAVYPATYLNPASGLELLLTCTAADNGYDADGNAVDAMADTVGTTGGYSFTWTTSGGVNKWSGTGDLVNANGYGDDIPRVVTQRTVATSVSSGTNYLNLQDTVNTIDAGIYSLASGGLLTKQFAETAVGEVILHQSRLVYGRGSVLHFTTPGVEDFNSPPDHYINLGAGDIVWMVSYPPSDLLVGTKQGAIFNIQGDLDDPTVRTLALNNSGVFRAQATALAPQGGVVLGERGPFFIGPDGSQQYIGRGLSEDHWFWESLDTNIGAYTIDYSEGYLFVRGDGTYRKKVSDETTASGDNYPTKAVWEAWREDQRLNINGFLAYDIETGAWFRTIHPDLVDAPAMFSVSRPIVQNSNTSRIVGLARKLIRDAEQPLVIGHKLNGQRSSVWEWRGAPLGSRTGRQLDLHEVQFSAYSHRQGADSDIWYTPGTITFTARNEYGETSTVAVDVPVGQPRVLTAPLHMKGTYVDVTIKAQSHDVNVEAPTLEYVAFGHTEDTVIRPTKEPSGGYENGYEKGY